MTPDLIYDQMVGMGLSGELAFSYVGNPGIGLCGMPEPRPPWIK